MNSVSLIGRLTRDPELKQAGELSICRFTIAVDRAKKGEADFIPVTAFGKTAEVINQYMSKGRQIGVTGRIQTGSYDNKETGKKVYTTDVIADRIDFIGSASDRAEEAPAPRQEQMDLPDHFAAAEDDIPF